MRAPSSGVRSPVAVEPTEAPVAPAAVAAPRVSVLVVARGEDPGRIRRLVEAVERSEGVAGVQVVLAAPSPDTRRWGLPLPRGAVGEITIVANERGARSTGLNLGLTRCTGAIVCRLDARTLPSPDHLLRCLDRLDADPEVGVVGGVQDAVAGGTGWLPRGVARALRNPWLLGGARYRRPGSAGAVDTVYLGAFRRSDLVTMGGWDERLAANEDYDLCQRYRRSGSTVWLEAGLLVGYEARAGLVAVARQYHAFGRAKVDYWRLRRRGPARRQLLALVGAGVGVALSACWVRGAGRAAAAVAAGLAGVAVIDHVADPAELDPAVRAGAVAASIVVMVSWLSGVLDGLLRGRSPQA